MRNKINIYLEKCEAERRNAEKFFDISTGQFSLEIEPAMKELENIRISRMKFAEIILRYLWCKKHGINYTKEFWWKK